MAKDGVAKAKEASAPFLCCRNRLFSQIMVIEYRDYRLSLKSLELKKSLKLKNLQLKESKNNLFKKGKTYLKYSDQRQPKNENALNSFLKTCGKQCIMLVG